MINQTIDEIAEACFDEMGVGEDEQGQFDTTSYMVDLKTGTEEQEYSDKTGEQSEKSKESEEPFKAPEERLYTKEELEQELTSRIATQEKEKPQDQAIPDLNREEFTTFAETDAMDGTKFVGEYLQKKMAERDLTDFELQKLREIDTENGSDLYGSYVSMKTKKDVLTELDPMLKTFSSDQTARQQAELQRREAMINDSNIQEFGDDLPILKSKVTDPKFIEKVLESSPIKNVIINEWDNGSKAMFQKLLLRETKLYLGKQIETKKGKSVQADIGGNAVKGKIEKASSIDEAFEAAEREFPQ